MGCQTSMRMRGRLRSPRLLVLLPGASTSCTSRPPLPCCRLQLGGPPAGHGLHSGRRRRSGSAVPSPFHPYNHAVGVGPLENGTQTAARLTAIVVENLLAEGKVSSEGGGGATQQRRRSCCHGGRLEPWHQQGRG